MLFDSTLRLRGAMTITMLNEANGKRTQEVVRFTDLLEAGRALQKAARDVENYRLGENPAPVVLKVEINYPAL